MNAPVLEILRNRLLTEHFEQDLVLVLRAKHKMMFFSHIQQPTLISDEYRHALRASLSSATADPVSEDNPTIPRRGHQDMHTDISSDTHHSSNTDNNHNACDTSDEDPRPAKR